jgi:hypothetical protein
MVFWDTKLRTLGQPLRWRQFFPLRLWCLWNCMTVHSKRPNVNILGHWKIWCNIVMVLYCYNFGGGSNSEFHYGRYSALSTVCYINGLYEGMNVNIVTAFCTTENYLLCYGTRQCVKIQTSISEETVASIRVMETPGSSKTSVCICHATAGACPRRWLLPLLILHWTQIPCNLHESWYVNLPNKKHWEETV